MAQRQNQLWMLGGIQIVATSRDSKDILSLKTTENGKSSVEN